MPQMFYPVESGVHIPVSLLGHNGGKTVNGAAVVGSPHLHTATDRVHGVADGGGEQPSACTWANQ